MATRRVRVLFSLLIASSFLPTVLQTYTSV